MWWHKIYGLSLRHIYLIKSSFPRILDLIYWPSIQVFLWGFISKFFTISSSYYNNTVGVILTAAILYDFLFRSSISYNMMFLEEIWSRNFTNLFIAPIKISEIIAALTMTAIFRTMIGLVPAVLLASHNMKEVERLCDSVIMMKEGQIVDRGTCKDLISRHGRDNLEDTFLKIARSNNEVA